MERQHLGELYTKVFVANFELAEILNGFTEDTQVVDETGRRLGTFRPISIAEREIYDQAREAFDRAEIDLRKQSAEPCITTLELLAKLDALEKAELNRK